MTRDKAKELLERDLEFIRDRAIEEAYGEPSDIRQAKLFYKQQMEALSILAPSPRTEPPTVDEVGDEEMCWVKNNGYSWYLYDGGFVRNMWGERYLKAWLPESALPMPKATDGTATFEKGEG